MEFRILYRRLPRSQTKNSDRPKRSKRRIDTYLIIALSKSTFNLHINQKKKKKNQQNNQKQGDRIAQHRKGILSNPKP